MRIAMTQSGPKHLVADAEIWDWVARSVDVLVARALIRKPKIRITRHYQPKGYYRPAYSDREVQAAGLWQAIYDDDSGSIPEIVKRARKAELI